MEFVFKYGIWEFPIHDLTPETQLLAEIGYCTYIKTRCHSNMMNAPKRIGLVFWKTLLFIYKKICKKCFINILCQKTEETLVKTLR